VNYSDGDPRDQLAHVGSEVVSAGLVVGSGGNLSARVPGTDEFWVTGAGTWLDQLDRDAYVQVGLDGNQSGAGTPTTGWTRPSATPSPPV